MSIKHQKDIKKTSKTIEKKGTKRAPKRHFFINFFKENLRKKE